MCWLWQPRDSNRQNYRIKTLFLILPQFHGYFSTVNLRKRNDIQFTTFRNGNFSCQLSIHREKKITNRLQYPLLIIVDWAFKKEKPSWRINPWGNIWCVSDTSKKIFNTYLKYMSSYTCTVHVCAGACAQTHTHTVDWTLSSVVQ